MTADVDRDNVRGTGGITSSNFPSRLQELRAFTQTFRSVHARDIANSVLTSLQSAWSIEQDRTGGPEEMSRGSSRYDEGSARNNR